MIAIPRSITGCLVILFILTLNVPYAALIEIFGYDDILREPTATTLAAFRTGGTPLLLAWLGFTVGALLFAPLAPLLDRAIGLRPGWTGVASAVAQTVGLARWVFIVPILAEAQKDAPPALMATIDLVYRAQHQMFGTFLGEILGQTLLLFWTARYSLGLLHLNRPLALLGMLTLPLWVLGLSEPLATVFPALIVIETTPLAFIGWQVWLIGVGGWLIYRKSLSAT